jgi:HD-GYP domain-containing protein (c-di-GMP phosphodiesterase class II)
MHLNNNIHKTVLQRLALAWVALSILLGGIVFYLETESTDDHILNLAVQESESFTSENLHRLNQPDPDLSGLRQKTTEFLKSHFIIVELYNRNKQKILEEMDPYKDAIEAELKKTPHSFPLAESTYYRKLFIGENVFLQVLLPLKEKNGAVAGYFEGVYQLDAETLRNIRNDVTRTLILVVVIVLATTLVLYPIIMSLNKGLITLSRNLLKGNIELMEVLGSAIAKRDSDTSVHNYRVTIYAIRLAETLNRADTPIRQLIAGAFLHDVGKIGISDNILLKPGKLTDEEFAVMRTHVTLGVDILAKSDWLLDAREVVEFHHEKYDGSGYPNRLKGEDIPLNARIFAIADVFDALVSMRPYKKAFPFDDAMRILQEGRGTHFDPRLLDAFTKIASELYTTINGQEDHIVEEMMMALVNKHFFSTFTASS